jgi:hypothetical protein
MRLTPRIAVSARIVGRRTWDDVETRTAALLRHAQTDGDAVAGRSRTRYRDIFACGTSDIALARDAGVAKTPPSWRQPRQATPGSRGVFLRHNSTQTSHRFAPPPLIGRAADRTTAGDQSAAATGSAWSAKTGGIMDLNCQTPRAWHQVEDQRKTEGGISIAEKKNNGSIAGISGHISGSAPDLALGVAHISVENKEGKPRRKSEAIWQLKWHVVSSQ